MPEQLLTPSDIAARTGATPQAINNWRNRHADFPDPVDHDGRTPLFPAAATVKWLRDNGKLINDTGATPSLAVRDLFDAFRSATESVPRNDIIRQVILPAVTGSTDTAFSAALARAKTAIGGAKTADLIVDLLSRVPGHVLSDFEVSTPLRNLIAAVAASPPGATTYDGCGGVGTLLAAITPPDGRAYMQEINPEATALANALLTLRGIDADAEAGDTVATDLHPLVRADRVVMAPSWSGKLGSINPDDPRWEYGSPSQFDNGEAWIMIALAHTAPNGRALIHLPSAVLESRAGRLMEQLVRQNLLDAVIELGTGQLAGSSVPSCLLVLDKNRPAPTITHHTSVLLADISTTASGSGRYQLTDAMVDRFTTTVWHQWHHTGFHLEQVATTVTLPELRAAEFDLRPARFLQQLNWPRPVDTSTDAPVHPAIVDLERLAEGVRSLSVAPPTIAFWNRRIDRSKPVTLRHLERDHALMIIQGSGEAARAARLHDGPQGVGRIVNVSDIPDNLLTAEIEPDLDWRPQPTERDRRDRQPKVRTGDILIATRWVNDGNPPVGVATPDMADAALGRSIAALRLEPESATIITSRYLRWWLATPRFHHFVTVNSSDSTIGGRLGFSKLRNFEFPLPSVNEQHELVAHLTATLAAITEQEQAHHRAAETYGAMRDLVLELFGAAHLNQEGNQS